MKIVLTSLAPASVEAIRRNEAHAKSLGFPRLGVAGTLRLAVVGGGPSIAGKFDELRAFDGDIWAINGAWPWCRDRGIEARFFSLDPSEEVLSFCAGANSAMLGMNCHPSVFNALKDIEAVDLNSEDFPTGPTTAASAPAIALHRGYREIHFFGCESSFAGASHAYGDFNRENLMRVACNGQEFLTTIDMLMQAEHLGAMIRGCGGVLVDRSGGLLAAYIASPDIDVLAATKSLHEAVSYAAA